jgi:transposase
MMQSFLRYCVGLDISKDTLQVCLSVIDSTGRVTVKATTKVVNKPAGFSVLLNWITRHRKLELPLTYLMESTGVYHEAVAWYLHQQDQSVSILLPNKAKYYLKSWAISLRTTKSMPRVYLGWDLNSKLPVWKPLSKNLYALRLLTRQHQRLQELKTQSTNQQHALEHSAFDNGFITKQLTNLVKVYDQQLTALEAAIAQLIDEDPVLKPRIEQLVKIKGLALLSVAVLVAETNGFEGFTNQRHLVSYAGYDVVENQSGNHSGKTRISKKGNSRLRRILHMPAFNAVRFNEPTCKALYERVYERSGIKMKAYVAVQKRLLLMAYALWRHGVDYDPEYLANRASKDKKIVPTGGTTQDQLAEAELSYL